MRRPWCGARGGPVRTPRRQLRRSCILGRRRPPSCTLLPRVLPRVLPRCSRPSTAPRRPRSTGTTAPPVGAPPLPRPRPVSHTSSGTARFRATSRGPHGVQPSRLLCTPQKLRQNQGFGRHLVIVGRLEVHGNSRKPHFPRRLTTATPTLRQLLSRSERSRAQRDRIRPLCRCRTFLRSPFSGHLGTLANPDGCQVRRSAGDGEIPADRISGAARDGGRRGRWWGRGRRDGVAGTHNPGPSCPRC